MSLSIQISQVGAVLLADGWHEIMSGTFDLDSYEFLDGADLVHGGGASGVCSTGFSYVPQSSGGTPGTSRICGPLTAVLAVAETVPPRTSA